MLVPDLARAFGFTPPVLLLALLVLSPGCRKSTESAEAAPSATVPANATELPALTLTDETPDLLLTWIDSQGDFHVVQKPAEVPEEGRKQVRVVISSKAEGTGQTVYVADLTQKAADNTYPVTTLSRSAWNLLGAERRKVRMEALKPLPTQTAIPDDQQGPPGAVTATIYGASWCKPCHDAEAFLKGLGVQVTKKDIEKSRAANAEMQTKLSKQGRSGASIPVIEVAGQLFIGFNPPALKQVVQRARQGQ